MCLGGGSETKTVESKVINQIPAWIEAAGQKQFESGQPLASRDYPGYPVDLRVAPFSSDTLAGFDTARATAGSWMPAFENAYYGAGAAGGPVSQADIDRYMNPFTDQVTKPIEAGFNQQLGRNLVQMRGNMAQRGSYLNEDRRALLETNEKARMEEAKLRAITPIQYQAFSDAVNQGNTDRNRRLQAAGLYGNLAPMIQNLGYGDTGALTAIGGQQEGREQSLRDISYDEFLKSFQYPQEQMNWLQGLLTSTPYSQTQTGTTQQLIPEPNYFAQAVGGASSLGGLGLLGYAALSSIHYKQDFRPAADVLPELEA